MTISKAAWIDSKLTDEALAAVRAQIGLEYAVKPWNQEVTKDAIWHFAYGVGDDNPLYLDPAYAAKSRWGRLVAPPTFLFSACSGPSIKPTGSNSSLGLAGLFGMWTHDSFEWHRPILAGDRFAKVTAHLAEVRERRSSFGGRAIEQVTETQFHNERNELVGKYWHGVTQFERGETRRLQKYANVSKTRYTDEEIERITRAYLAEEGNRRGGTPRYWDDIQVDQPVNSLVKGPVTFVGMSVFLMGWGSPMAIANRIAFKHISAHPRDRLVNLETNVPDTLEAGHWDEHFAKNSGLPGPYDFGPMRICWCGHAVTDWMGDDGFLKRLSVRLRRPNFVGDTTWVHGKVVRKYQENNEALVDCELWCDNQRNEVTAFGQATVVLPVRGH